MDDILEQGRKKVDNLVVNYFDRTASAIKEELNAARTG